VTVSAVKYTNGHKWIILFHDNNNNNNNKVGFKNAHYKRAAERCTSNKIKITNIKYKREAIHKT
jgi:hypothetical protein